MPEKAMVIYDGSCPLCRGMSDWMMGRAYPGLLMPVPCQSAETARAASTEGCGRAMCILTESGALFSGADAIPHVMARLQRWDRLAWVFRIPGVLALARPVYRWVARNRFLLSRCFHLNDAAVECAVEHKR